MRPFLVLLALLLLEPERAQPELVFAVATGTILERTVATHSVLELASMAMTLDGEDVPPESLGEFEVHIERDELLAVRDEYEAMAAGRPERLRRTFTAVGGTETTRATTGGIEDNQDVMLVSALAGHTVVFAWSDEDARFEARFAAESESESDAGLLAGLQEDLDLRRFLPQEPVSAGDAWEVDARLFESLLEPGGNLALVAEGSEGGPAPTDALVRDNMEGTIRALHRGTEVVDGVRCARIELELDVRTHTENPVDPESMPPGASGTSTNTLHFELAGALLWDLEHGHAHALELAGENAVTIAHDVRGELDGTPFVQTQTLRLEGEYAVTLRVARP